MGAKTHVFEETYRNYLGQIAAMDFRPFEEILGVKVEKDKVIIPFFGKPYVFTEKSIANPAGKQPSFEVCVVLCKYLLLCPEVSPTEGDWIAYRDFKDAGPLTNFFANNVERSAAEYFAGKLAELEKSCERLGGSPPDIELAYDLSAQFQALPRIPILMLFNDADDEFPAHCSMLFERRADKHLDAESLAILGNILTGYLTRQPPRYEKF
jgi:hypothetical protein